MAEQKDDIFELYQRYQTTKETLAGIKDGATVVCLHYCSGGYTDLKELIESPDYLDEIKRQMMMSLREIRTQLISALQEEDKAELGYSDDDNDRNVEPFPIGTPKSDHRRTLTDTDDGK